MLLALIFLLPSLNAFAGSFKAVPVKLSLDSRTKTAVLKVINEGEDKLTIQVEAVSWKQDKDGKDIYEPTKDIVFFPKIFTIDKNEEKVLRVGYSGKKVESAERTYRLFLQELPVSKPGEVAIKMALRMGLPVFIKPAKEVKEGSVEKAELSQGNLLVRIKNSGNSHFIVSKIKATGQDESGKEAFSKEAAGWYVLSGGSRVFAVEVPKDDCLKAKEIKVEAEAEKLAMNGSLQVDKTLCADRPKETPKGPKKEKEGK